MKYNDTLNSLNDNWRGLIDKINNLPAAGAGGDYNVESVSNGDGTQNLIITDAANGSESSNNAPFNMTCGEFTPTTSRELYHDVEGYDDSVYEIVHGKNLIPTMFFLYDDTIEEDNAPNFHMLGAPLIIIKTLNLVTWEYKSPDGSTRIPYEALFKFGSSQEAYPRLTTNADLLTMNNDKIILQGYPNRTNQQYSGMWLFAGHTYKWVAFFD